MSIAGCREHSATDERDPKVVQQGDQGTLVGARIG
jgi:hypothetical protein